MLKEMRRHAKYLYVLFFIVILSFVFWGVGSVNKSNTPDAVATINGEKITLTEYWRTYERMDNFMTELYGDKYDQKMKDALKGKVLSDLVTDTVLYKQALQSGLTVSDREVSDAIAADPTFQRDGVFRPDVYQRTLELNHISSTQYEQTKKRGLLVQKFSRLIEDPIELSPEETQALPADQKTADMVKETLLGAKKERAFASYLGSLERQMKITLKPELVS
jgi:peptidyl-prolyl cis-trans isomerase D